MSDLSSLLIASLVDLPETHAWEVIDALKRNQDCSLLGGLEICLNNIKLVDEARFLRKHQEEFLETLSRVPISINPNNNIGFI